ncbi:hypothetical protein [Frankia tisae]|nr:hypothetical protein [Frankia tisae]
MRENTVYVDLNGLTAEEIDQLKAAAGPLGADLEDLSVQMGAEELLPYAPVVIALLKPFLQKAAEVAAPQLNTFLERAFAGRRNRTVYLEDLDVYLLWGSNAEKQRTAALQAIRLLEPGAFRPGVTLTFNTDSGRWQEPGQD